MTLTVEEIVGAGGLAMVRIENAALTLDVIPHLGGKIVRLVDKQARRDVLWHNPAIGPARAECGSNFDDHFSGGWDDIFPNAAECVDSSGRRLPHMGEIWTLPLDHTVRSSPTEVRLQMSGVTPVTATRWTRTLVVAGDEPVVELTTDIENLSDVPLDFMWGSHPTLAIHPGFRFDIPATNGRVLEGDGGLLGRVGDAFAYPDVHDQRFGGGVRTALEKSAGGFALYSYDNLGAGWVAATDPTNGRGFGLVFDTAVSRSAWQWIVYGGFREWYHVALEAWTAPHLDLSEARRDGTARQLMPGRSFSSRMRGVLYGGVSGVSDLTWDGNVTEGTRFGPTNDRPSPN